MGMQETLARLKGMTSQNKGSGVKYFKAKKGKNNLLFLSTEQTGDPFLEWGIHKNLLEPGWKSIPCSKHNRGEECLACTIIDDLKKQNWKGNYPLWKPIELKIEFYSPIIDLDDVAAGLQWFRYGKTVLTQMQNWLMNLEEGESPFYDLEHPEKIIVTYDPDKDPTLMYSLDKKSIKTLPDNIEELAKNIKPLSEVLLSNEKTVEEIAGLLEEYMSHAEEKLKEAEDIANASAGENEENNEETSDNPKENPKEKPLAAPKKLSELKGGPKGEAKK
jgi:hypothetical protein